MRRHVRVKDNMHKADDATPYFAAEAGGRDAQNPAMLHAVQMPGGPQTNPCWVLPLSMESDDLYSAIMTK